MDISIKHIADPAAERCGCLVLPVADGGKFGTMAARLDQATGGQLARLVKTEHFSGAAGKSVLLHHPAGIAAQRLLQIEYLRQFAFDHAQRLGPCKSIGELLQLFQCTSLTCVRTGECRAHRFVQFQLLGRAFLSLLKRILGIASRRRQTAAVESINALR